MLPKFQARYLVQKQGGTQNQETKQNQGGNKDFKVKGALGHCRMLVIKAQYRDLNASELFVRFHKVGLVKQLVAKGVQK